MILDSNRVFLKDLDNVLLDGFGLPFGKPDVGFWFCFSWILDVYTNQLLNTKLIVVSGPYNCMITLFYIYGNYYTYRKPTKPDIGKQRLRLKEIYDTIMENAWRLLLIKIRNSCQNLAEKSFDRSVDSE